MYICIYGELYEWYKINFGKNYIEAMKKEFTLQKLVNRSIDLYIVDDDFRNKIHGRIIENKNRY